MSYTNHDWKMCKDLKENSPCSLAVNMDLQSPDVLHIKGIAEQKIINGPNKS